ncbi:apoptosis-associated speck-like protein containing a CARD [Engraulis encrasicolus]|uniref:apoptosis-associated speck-like protein containing a CARD n=1 Tax=Engraulis encrasicolus TaxID=184585 RepID=UPI002FD447D1
MATILIKSITVAISKGLALYNHLQKMEENKKSCACLAERIKTLVDTFKAFEERGVSEEVVQKSLEEFQNVLEEADIIQKKFENTSGVRKTITANSLKKDFDKVNRQIDETVAQLNLCLQKEELKHLDEQRQRLEEVFDAHVQAKQDADNYRMDAEEWNKKILSALEETKDSVEETKAEVRGVRDVVDCTAQDVREIKDAVVGQASGSAGGSSKYMVGDKHFIDKHRTTLIQRVSNVDAILDHLLDNKVIKQETYSKIRRESTSYDKMRVLMEQGNQL